MTRLGDLPARTGRRATLAQLGVAALGALLWVIAAPPFDLWPLGWVAMAPILWLWAGAPTARRAGWLGFAAGTLMSIGGFYWFAPLMKIHASLPWPAAILVLVAVAAWQGVGWLLAGRATWWILDLARRRAIALPLALVAPVTVVAVEHAWPVIFPYQLAITQANALAVIQVADLLGASAVTALIVAAAGAIVDGARGAPRAARAGAIVAGVTVAVVAYGAWRLGDVSARRDAAPTVRVGLVQPNEPMLWGGGGSKASEDLRRHRRVQDVSARLEQDGAELIVWSEASFPADLPRSLRRDLRAGSQWRLRRGFDAPVVVGAITEEGRDRYNSSLLLVGDDLVARHDKVHRVLGSEWNPLVEWFPSLDGMLPRGFAGGTAPVVLPARLRDGRELRLGPMVCYEDVISSFGRRLAAQDVDLLVNQTNDTWFGTFAEPWQHRALAVFRAVELRADMVRAVNTGPSGLIEATGRIGPQTPVRPDPAAADVEGIVVDAKVMRAGQTVYAAIGDVFAWACVVAAIVGWWLGRRGRKRDQKEAEKGAGTGTGTGTGKRTGTGTGKRTGAGTGKKIRAKR